MAFPFFSNKHYSLYTKQRGERLYIKMQIFSDVVNTRNLPHTYDILCEMLPGIHSSLCFNNANLPFSQEVKNTEIGHLFEHILLEYLYQLISKDEKSIPIVVTGETTWNWNKDPKGLFHIKIKSETTEYEILNLAYYKSISLIDKILNKNSFSDS